MTNKEFFVQTWQQEQLVTIIALKALPEGDKLNYRYQPKSRSIKELTDHFVSHAEDLAEALEDGVINHRITANYSSVAEAINVFERTSARLIELVIKTSDADWEKKDIPLLIFGKSFGALKLGSRCWQFLLDIVHHRGQLSTTYRHIGVTQPAIYGPTAEMTEAIMGQMSKAN